MKLLKSYIKEALKLEGALEKKKISIDELVNRLNDSTIVFIDTETTGLNPRKPYVMITEIAAVAYDMNSGTELETYHAKAELRQATLDKIVRQQADMQSGALVPNGRMKTIRQLLDMTNYYVDDVGKTSEVEMLQGFSDMISKYSGGKAYIAAHNARFDMYQINKALETNGLPKISGFNVIDTLVLVRGYLKPMLLQLEKEKNEIAINLLKILRPEKRFIENLATVGQAFDIENKNWHSALADVNQLVGILSALLNFFKTHGAKQDSTETY